MLHLPALPHNAYVVERRMQIANHLGGLRDLERGGILLTLVSTLSRLEDWDCLADTLV